MVVVVVVFRFPSTLYLGPSLAVLLFLPPSQLWMHFEYYVHSG